MCFLNSKRQRMFQKADCHRACAQWSVLLDNNVPCSWRKHIAYCHWSLTVHLVTAYSSWIWPEKRRSVIRHWRRRSSDATASASNGASSRCRSWRGTPTIPSERLSTEWNWLRTRTKTWSLCLSVSPLSYVLCRSLCKAGPASGVFDVFGRTVLRGPLRGGERKGGEGRKGKGRERGRAERYREGREGKLTLMCSWNRAADG